MGFIDHLVSVESKKGEAIQEFIGWPNLQF